MTGDILRAALGLFVYSAAFLALRLLPNQAYAAYLNTAMQLAGDVACVVLAFLATRSVKRAWRGFFRAIGVASLFLLVANVFWGLVINVWAIDPNTTMASLSYRIPYLLCLVCWAIAWLELVVRQINRSASIALFLTALLVGGALGGLLVQYYGPLIFDSANPHRAFVFLYVGLEIAALLFCIGAAIIEITPYPVIIATGYALLVAADFVFNTNELRDTVAPNSFVEIPWTLAQVCVALGLRSLWRALAEEDSQRVEVESNASAHFAIPLLSVTLGAGLVGSMIARFIDTDTIALGCYLFATAITAIAISVLARAHTRAARHALQNIKSITKRGALSTYDGGTAEILRLFGSAAILDVVRAHLRLVRAQTIPYGVDRLFFVEDAWMPEQSRRVFIAMPFSRPWSTATDAWLRSTIAAMGLAAVRADELFETRDALSGIWRGICESALVVADLTGRNPNVLYEVGIAHCLGKPVVFTCQRSKDIPFDLATRRVVLYSPSQLDEATPRLRKALAGSQGLTGDLLGIGKESGHSLVAGAQERGVQLH